MVTYMAKFNTNGIDDVMKDFENTATGIDDFACPNCGKPFRLEFDDEEVTCPHCNSTISITHK
jgi:hypothetical protein